MWRYKPVNCPNCNIKMDFEDAPIVQSNDWATFLRTRKEVSLLAGGHYYCPSCDSEWVWLKGHGRPKCIDSAIPTVAQRFGHNR